MGFDLNIITRFSKSINNSVLNKLQWEGFSAALSEKRIKRIN